MKYLTNILHGLLTEPSSSLYFFLYIFQVWIRANDRFNSEELSDRLNNIPFIFYCTSPLYMYALLLKTFLTCVFMYGTCYM